MPCACAPNGNRFAFAVVDDTTGTVLGTTSYHDILPAVKRVEIGYAGLPERAAQPREHHSKLLMMGHAFDTWAPCGGLGTDNFNFARRRHRAAGRQERDGVIRGHALRRDGTIRDTVMAACARANGPRPKHWAPIPLAPNGTACLAQALEGKIYAD